MPREEAEVIYKKVRQAALSIDPMLWVEIMGSYRRGCSDCGDVDILITRPTHDGQTHRGLLNKILLCLKEDEVITHTLGEPDNGDELEAKFMGLCRVDSMTKTRRIDILTVPFECWGSSLIYFTGDDIFNRSMRLLARHQGLTLNQRGLWKGASRFSRTNEQITEGVLVASTEEDIFRRLGVPWQEPHERIRSR
ncbi:hypothetical protein FRC03_011157 [Tulasnella sp. 419]|nr:hypothetical protein FRC03_011157 [Tulasnella sp. 419]